MTARRHHYLPQCYLKGFVRHRETPKLFVVDAEKKVSFTTNTLNVAQVRDFHRLDLDGVSPDALEAALSEFEGELAPALEKIIATQSLADERDRILLLNLIAVVAAKNPRLREQTRIFSEDVLKIAMQAMTATPERWSAQLDRMEADGYDAGADRVDYDGMRDFVRRDEYSISMNREFHLEMEFKSMDGVLRCLVDRDWVLLRAPRGETGFITSDYPVCLDWIDPKDRGFYRPGFGLDGTQVIFPISNSLAVIGRFEFGEVGEAIDIDTGMVAALNTVILRHADRQIYARDGEFRYREAREGKLTRGVDLPKDPLLGAARSKSSGR